MKVLVTGHTGYIGAVLVPMLIEEDHVVTGLDTDFYAGCDFVGQLAEVPAMSKDLRDVAVDDLREFDAVIHLAALSNDPLSDLNPGLTYEINHRASVRLAELAKAAGVPRFLFSSSCSLYGLSEGADLLAENASFNPVTPYGESKVLVERDVSRIADDTFSPTFLRNSTAYGVSPRLRADLVVNNLVGFAYTTGEVLIASDGTPWRPLSMWKIFAAHSWPFLRHLENLFTINLSISAKLEKIIKSAISRKWCEKSCPEAVSNTQKAADPTFVVIASIATKLPRPFRTLNRSGRCVAGLSNCTKPIKSMV